MTRRYTTSSGEVLELNLTEAEAQYFAHLQQLAGDVTASVADLVMALYSADNPIMEKGPDGMGWVTRAVFSRPAYHAFTDLLQRKEAQRRLAVELERRFSVSVAQAAAELGISERSVRRAITENRLPGLKVKGQHYTTEAGLAAYKVGKTGPQSDSRIRRTMPGPLEIVEGSSPGHSLEFKTDGKRELVERRGRTVRLIRVTDWTWAVVKTNDTTREERGRRLFLLRPADQFEHMDFGPLGFDGGLQVAARLNNPEEVSSYWKEPGKLGSLPVAVPTGILRLGSDSTDIMSLQRWTWALVEADGELFQLSPAATETTIIVGGREMRGAFTARRLTGADEMFARRHHRPPST